MITSSTQCTEVRALNLCATRRLGARDPIQDSDTKDLKNLTENYAYSSTAAAAARGHAAADMLLLYIY